MTGYFQFLQHIKRVFSLFLTALKFLQCSGSKIALVSSEGLELVALSSNTSAVYKLFSVVVPLCSLASPAASLNVALNHSDRFCKFLCHSTI